MSIYERYELLELVNDGPVKTFRARQVQTGQIVAIHLLLPASNPQSIIQKVRTLTDPARRELLEFGDHEGTWFVVSNEWKRMMSFTEWLSAVAPPQASAAPPAPPQSETPGAGADRFSKAGNWRIPVSEFGRKMDPISGTPAPPEPQVPPLPSDPNPPTPEPPAPVVGEFTRMFEAATRNDSQVGAAPQIEDVGEFTRMFEAQNPPASGPPAPQQPRPPVKEAAGEFTRMFQTPSAPPAPPASPISSEYNRVFQGADSNPNVNLNETMEMPAAKPQARPEPQPKNEPGDFTRMFRAPAAPSAPPPPVSPSAPTLGSAEFAKMFETPTPPNIPQHPQPSQEKNEPGEFTRMFQTPAASSAPPSPPSVDRPFISSDREPHPAEPIRTTTPEPQKAAASEFTRMFQTPAASPSPQTPPAPAPTAPAAGGEFTRMFETPAAAPASSADRPFITPDRPSDRHSRFSRTLPNYRRPVPATSLGCSRPRRRHDRLRKRRHKLLLLLHRPRRQREESLLGCLRHRLPRPLHLRIGRSSHRIARRDRHSRFTRTLPNHRRPVPATSLGCSRPRPRHDRLRKRRHKILLLLHRPRQQREESLLGCLKHRLPRPPHRRIGRSLHRIEPVRQSRLTLRLRNHQRQGRASLRGCSRPPPRLPRHRLLRRGNHRKRRTSPVSSHGCSKHRLSPRANSRKPNQRMRASSRNSFRRPSRHPPRRRPIQPTKIRLRKRRSQRRQGVA